jgi:outer membrane cobalamin receptor
MVLVAVVGLAPSIAPAEEPAAPVPPVSPVATTVYETATVHARAVVGATTAVTVVEREQIERSGAVTAADVLAAVPGVTVSAAGSRGGLATARIRGGDPNFTLVLVDGVPVNDGTYQVGGVFDLEGLPAGAIERIEVVRGPFSSFYGSTGLAGVVRIVTRTGSGTNGGEVALEAGSGDRRAGRLFLGAGSFALGGSWEEESGRVAEESFDGLHLHGGGAVGLGRAGTLRLSGRIASWRSDDYPEASGGPVHGSGRLRSSDHGELSLAAELDGSGRFAGHRLRLGAYRHRLDRESPAIGFVVPDSAEETRFTRIDGGWSWSRLLEAGAERSLRWGAVVDVEHEEGDNASLLLLPPAFGGAVSGDYGLSRTTPGGGVDLLATRGRWTAEGGLRVDVPDGEGARWSPRLGLAFQASDAWRLRASAGRAFKLPSFFALASPPALGGNPDLSPETMTGGDLGLSWRGAGGHGSAEVALFVHRYRDLVDFDFERFTHLNRSRVEARGVEWGWTARPAERLGWAVDLTYQEVEDEATGETLRNRPDWHGGARLDWWPRGPGEVRVHLAVRHAGEQRDEQIPVPELTRVEPVTLVDLGLSGELAGWRLDLRVDNVLDDEAETFVGFPAPGRGLRVGVGRSWGSSRAAPRRGRR